MIQDAGYWIQNIGYRIQYIYDTEYRIKDITGHKTAGHMIQDTGYRVQETEHKIQDTGYI